MNRFRSIVLAGAAVACMVGASAPAASAATTACPVTASSQLFAPWADANYYAPFQGSTFESGASGWSWGGGSNIVTGDDDHQLSATGSHAVQVPGGGTAKSPHVCVDNTMPSMRFFVKRVSGFGSLTVTATLSGTLGFTTTVAVVTGTAVWAPSQPVLFPNALLGSNVQFFFSSPAGTTYRIDDIEMDPYRRT
jgi:hypothetical protein